MFIDGIPFLDNRDSGILKHANPLAIPGIRIQSISSGNPHASASGSRDMTAGTLTRIGNFLMSQLRVEYEQKGEKIRDHDVHTAVCRLKEQFIAYAKGVWPFNRSVSAQMDVASYWHSFMEHDDADVLAVSLHHACHLYKFKKG